MQTRQQPGALQRMFEVDKLGECIKSPVRDAALSGLLSLTESRSSYASLAALKRSRQFRASAVNAIHGKGILMTVCFTR